MTGDSHCFELRWYLRLGGNALISPFYNRDLHVVINRCRLTRPGFPPYVDIVGTPILAPKSKCLQTAVYVMKLSYVRFLWSIYTIIWCSYRMSWNYFWVYNILNIFIYVVISLVFEGVISH